MANFRKSFNFRNGVQVDDDNLVVNSNGLVGIGTSVPSEVLDIRGTTKVVGLVTATEVFAQNIVTSGVSTFSSGLRVGIVSVGQNGIVTATSGVVTYFGDGGKLSNLPTSQWVDTDVGLGFTSIYAQGNVGVATVDPRFTFQVGGNANSSLTDFSGGVGINSRGSILATGIITATTFSGSLTGTVTGDINSTGVGTFNNLKVGTVTIGSGVVTATTFKGSVLGDVTGTASTATSLSGTPNITVATITATAVNTNNSTTGVSTATTFHVGTGGTGFTALSGGRIGVGTALPTSEFQIRKSSDSLLEVISNTGSSRISIGQSVGVGKSTGVLRFGDSDKTLDLINNDTGNINYYLHAGAAGVGTGRFEWVYGQTNAQLMSLTHTGSLGLGKTNPDNTLHVVGTSTVTGNAFFGNDVTIKGALSATSLSLPTLTGQLIGNVYAATGVSTFTKIETTENLIVGSGSSIGIGTTRPIVALDARDKTALFGSIGINTSVSEGGLTVIGGGTFSSGVGIGTTSTSAYLGVYGNIEIYNAPGTQTVPINIYTGEILTNNKTTVGLGTTSARSALDFADVGKGFAGGTNAFMIVPRATDAERALFGTGVGGIGTSAGAIIFNTTTSKFQGYTGIAWTDLH